MKLNVLFEPEEELEKTTQAEPLEQQFALLQCPQCGGWFSDTSDRRGEACPECFEGWKTPVHSISNRA